MSKKVVLLSPSQGRGGGIERYVETIEWAFQYEGIEHWRIDLDSSGPASHARILGQARRLMRTISAPTRLVLAHRALLPVAFLLNCSAPVVGISLICHGSDVWGTERTLRRYVESRLMARPEVRVVAASSCTAGALARICPVAVLPPGISREWFNTLIDASSLPRERTRRTSLITAFRLEDWRSKGLPELVEALQSIGRDDVYLTVCGSGRASSELKQLVAGNRFLTLKSGLADFELAQEFAMSDLFILATRTNSRRPPSGEGFGLVLIEAQIAGTPVVAPAYGGSHDAYVHGITGDAPLDETAGSLAHVISSLLDDPRRLASMASRAAIWARESFDPDRYSTLAVQQLLRGR